jgi:hypothetical protein
VKVVLRKASVGTKKGKFQLSNNRIWLKRPKYRPKTSHQLPLLAVPRQSNDARPAMTTAARGFSTRPPLATTHREYFGLKKRDENGLNAWPS